MNILKLERDRNKLCTDFSNQEKKTEHQQCIISDLKNLQVSQENNMQEMLKKTNELTQTISTQDGELESMNLKLRESNARFL